MSLIGHPDRRQLARPMELGQHEGIAAVGLHPVARLHRDERGGDDHAVMTHLDELPVDAVAAGTGLMAEVRRSPLAAQLLGQLLGQFADVIGAVGDPSPSGARRLLVLHARWRPRSSPCGHPARRTWYSALGLSPIHEARRQPVWRNPRRRMLRERPPDPASSHRDHRVWDQPREPPTRSRASSPPSATGPSGPRAPCRRRPRASWSVLARHGLQARHGRLEDLAPPEGREPLAHGPRRRHLHQRRRPAAPNHRAARSGPVTQVRP